MSRLRFRWDADDPDMVSVWVEPDDGAARPLLTTRVADLDAEMARVNRDKWQHEMRQQARILAAAEQPRLEGEPR